MEYKSWQPNDFYDFATEFTRISSFIYDIGDRLGIYDLVTKLIWETSDIPYYEDYKQIIYALNTLLQKTHANEEFGYLTPEKSFSYINANKIEQAMQEIEKKMWSFDITGKKISGNNQKIIT